MNHQPGHFGPAHRTPPPPGYPPAGHGGYPPAGPPPGHRFPGPVPPGMPGGPGAAGPGAPRSKKPIVITAIIGALVLIGAGVAGVVFLSGDDRPDRPDMVTNPHFDGLAFPDPAALAYDKGADAVCEAVGKTMLARGYQLLSVTDARGVNCRFGTPGTSVLEEGAYNLTTDVFVAHGPGAVTAYDNFLTATVRTRDKFRADPQFVFSELYELKLGEEGFFSHSEFKPGPAGNATAAFRSGEATFYISIGGVITRLGKDEKEDPITEEITRREVVDIVKSLTGDKSAGPSQIKPSPLKDLQGLPPLGSPRLPNAGDATGKCAPVTEFAGRLGLETDKTASLTGRQSGVLCVYKPSDETYRQKNDFITRNVEVTARDYKDAPEHTLPSEDLASDLRTIVEQSKDGKTTPGELYRLPVGQSGYLVYTKSETTQAGDVRSSGRLTAAYILDEVYIKITISGATWTHPQRLKTIPVALSEQALVNDLTTLLTAMNT